jgi:replicative superfamily II helicase
MTAVTFPIRYAPNKLTKKDRQKQIQMLLTSKKMYKQHKYYTRKKISSYTHKPSKHLANARKIYDIINISPNKELANKTGCTLEALQQIVKKGEGAYYSSGSRPNQTPQSWGLARLASAITSGKAAAVDYNIIEKGCNHQQKTFILANKARKKYKYGHSKTKRTTFNI